MSEPVYFAYRAGFPGRVPAKVAYESLEKIRQKHKGDLRAEIVVEEARPKSHPLHPQIFNIGQKAAADEYYKLNARHLIRSIVVRYKETPQLEPTQVYVGKREEESAKHPSRKTVIYGDTRESLKDPDERAYVLSKALKELADLRHKYSALSELANVFGAIDQAVAANS